MLNSDGLHILFQITGSISAYKACGVVSSLVQSGHQVQVVTSPSASHFIGMATLEGLTQRKIAQNMFAPGEMMNHIQWARWADIFILCPATANQLNQLAHGLGFDLISNIFLCQDFTKPYLIFPAMNSHMLRHPITQQSMNKLISLGVSIFPTQSGTLACGEIGEGKLMEPEDILSAISPYLRRNSHQEVNRSLKSAGTNLSAAFSAESPDHTEQVFNPPNLRILVTAGGTSEPLDEVRIITNRSTGTTGCRIAEGLATIGHQVTLLRARSGAKALDQLIESHEFEDFNSLKISLQNLLARQPFDVIILTAAVSDFSIDRIEDESGAVLSPHQKLSSDRQFSIRLKSNPKLIQSVREWSCRRNPLVVGFKLTSTSDPITRIKAVEKLQESANPDFIVANDLTEISADHHTHRFVIYRNNQIFSQGENRSELVREISDLVMKFAVQEQAHARGNT